MNKTYEQILDSMKNAYFNEYGEAVDSNSQTMKRFEMLASELFSLSCYGDYIYKQAFVQTATGENLDKLGEIRGCTRKSASCAEGNLTFSISEASEEDITIPVGTVCSVADKPYMQYKTTEKGVISAGETQVSVNAIALTEGDEYNVEANEITVMVNAPVGVTSVTNESELFGGCDEELDTSYRNRIMRHYSILPNGSNLTAFENNILTLNAVTDCNIPETDSTGMLYIYVATKTNSLTTAIVNNVAKKVPIIELAGIPYTVKLATQKKYVLSVDAYIMTGFDEDEITQQIKDKVSEIASTLRIGRFLSLNKVARELRNIDGLEDCNVYSSQATGNEIYCKYDEILYYKGTAVKCFYD